MSVKVGAAAFAILAAAMVAGCQQGATTSTQTSLEPGQIRESELRAYCPRPTLREETVYMRQYERGGDGDPNRLVFQAVISDTTRACQYNQGSGVINVVAAGRLVPGPKGRPGTYTLPIRVIAMRGDQVLYSQVIRHQVNVSDVAGATQFFLSDPNVVIPGGIDRSVQVSIGFEGGTRN